jgi:predicted Zn-dependent protease
METFLSTTKNTKKINLKNSFLIFFILMPLISCVSSTKEGDIGVERKQLLLLPNSEILSMSEQSYIKTLEEAQSKGTLDRNSSQVQRVKAIGKKLIPQTAVFRSDAPAWNWDIHVISSPELNAYCMPGGKIVFYTGIIEQLNLTDGEIAAIMGHEIAHALREHGRERMSEELVKNLALQALIASGELKENYVPYAALVSSLVMTLPHSRGQETEADEVGLELMARAGFNPEEAIMLWKKMSANSGGKPPEILSTHPSDTKRMENMRKLIPKVKHI